MLIEKAYSIDVSEKMFVNVKPNDVHLQEMVLLFIYILIIGKELLKEIIILKLILIMNMIVLFIVQIILIVN